MENRNRTIETSIVGFLFLSVYNKKKECSADIIFTVSLGVPGAGLITMAAGCALIALAFVFFWLAKGLIKIIPAVIRGIVDFCQNIFNRVGDRR